MSQESEKEWTVATLKDHLEQQVKYEAKLHAQEIAALKEGITLARGVIDHRLGELNQLRKEVMEDRSELVRNEVYRPAHDDLLRQRRSDTERIIKLEGDVKSNNTDMATLKSNMSWLTRLLVGAVLLGIITYVFQKLTGR